MSIFRKVSKKSNMHIWRISELYNMRNFMKIRTEKLNWPNIIFVALVELKCNVEWVYFKHFKARNQFKTNENNKLRSHPINLNVVYWK